MSKAKKTTKKEVVVEAKKSVGRPSNPESKRQQKITEREAKREAGLLKRGRPSVEGSKRQAVLAAREAKRAAGMEIKPGRPKTVKTEEVNDIVQLEHAE